MLKGLLLWILAIGVLLAYATAGWFGWELANSGSNPNSDAIYLTISRRK